MKKLFVLVALLATMSSASSAQESYTRTGNQFRVERTTAKRDVRAGADSTKYTIQDGQHVRTIWVVRSTGSCFYIRVSKKTGNEYRQYCPREMSAAICAEMGREYNPKNAKK